MGGAHERSRNVDSASIAPGDGMDLDIAGFPVVVTRYLRTPTAADFENYGRRFRADVLSRAKPYAHIADLSNLRLADPATRRLGAALANELSSLTDRYAVVSIVVVQSTIVRGILTAIRWMVPATGLELNAATMADAADIAERCLDEKQIELSDSCREALRRLRDSDG